MTVVRLDRFTLPATARDRLLARIGETHALLRRQPGFLGDAILERDTAAGLEIVTSAEWSDEPSVAAARDVVAARQRATGFDRVAFLAEAGITAEFASLHRLELPPDAPQRTPIRIASTSSSVGASSRSTIASCTSARRM